MEVVIFLGQSSDFLKKTTLPTTQIMPKVGMIVVI
jgi:hypothetical protein